jgi:hypothetical protein
MCTWRQISWQNWPPVVSLSKDKLLVSILIINNAALLNQVITMAFWFGIRASILCMNDVKDEWLFRDIWSAWEFSSVSCKLVIWWSKFYYKVKAIFWRSGARSITGKLGPSGGYRYGSSPPSIYTPSKPPGFLWYHKITHNICKHCPI